MLLDILTYKWSTSNKSWVNEYKEEFYYSEQNISSIQECNNSPITVHPNPFDTETTIKLNLQNAGSVELFIYDLSGRIHKTITSEQLNPGKHRFTWYAKDFPQGVYFCVFKTNESVQMKKIIKQ